MTHSITGSIAVTFLNSVFDTVRKSGLDLASLLTEVGLAENPEDDGCNRIPAEQYCRLLETGAELCQDDCFGLHVGESIKPGHYGVLGYACMSAADFPEIIQRMHRYQALVSDIGLSRVTIDTDKVRFEYVCNVTPFPPRQLAEEHIAGIVTFARWVSGHTNAPISVHFQHPAPVSTAEHERIFKCPVLFDQEETAIYFSTELMHLPLPQADSVVSKMMESCARDQLSRLARENSLLEQANMALINLLQNGEPSLDKLADYLKMSPRALQRKLSEQQINYQSLLDRVRHELALSYIQEARLSLTDIAFLLGFSEQSSFQRAFKRWTNETPGKYRRNISLG